MIDDVSSRPLPDVFRRLLLWEDEQSLLCCFLFLFFLLLEGRSFCWIFGSIPWGMLSTVSSCSENTFASINCLMVGIASFVSTPLVITSFKSAPTCALLVAMIDRSIERTILQVEKDFGFLYRPLGRRLANKEQSGSRRCVLSVLAVVGGKFFKCGTFAFFSSRDIAGDEEFVQNDRRVKISYHSPPSIYVRS